MDRHYAEEIVNDIRRQCSDADRVVFVSGDFNVVHPGHLRLFNFAKECGDFLVVGVNADGRGNAILKQELRLEAVRANSVVDYVFLLDCPSEDFIEVLRPNAVVKGSEYSGKDNPEQVVVNAYGGELIFCSGDIRFSSLDLLRHELDSINFSTIVKSWDFLDRRGYGIVDLEEVVKRYHTAKAVVIGDLIVDQYVTCEPLGMSQEDPTIVVSPLTTDTFIGGAGIVAAHLQALGAETTFISVVGRDEMADFARMKFRDYKVNAILTEDHTRPTTFKKRYRASGKTMLRVNHVRQHNLSKELCAELFKHIEASLEGANLLIFSDFNYGILPQAFVDDVTRLCKERGIFIAADSQASSQIGDISRFRGMNLITPTEREARLACHDFTSGLAALASTLQHKADAENLILTLGSEGVLIHINEENARLHTDRLPAFNTVPVDVSGAGDSLLACTGLSMAIGANIWQASFLGAIASACQVGRVGNIPLTQDTILTELRL